MSSGLNIALKAKDYSLLRKFFYSLIILLWFYKFLSGLTVSALHGAVLPYEGRDPSYWLLIGLSIPQTLIKFKLVLYAIDILIPSLAILSLLLRKVNIFPLLFTLLYLIYFLLFNVYTAHHYHSIGVLLISVLFWTDPGSLASARLFSFLRLAFFFMLSSAFMWKLVRGNLWDIEHFSNILKNQNIYFFQAFPESWRAESLIYLIKNPPLAHAFWVGLMLLQASFIIGFISQKRDGLLVILYLLFAIGSWFFMNIVNLDNYFWLLILFPLGVLPYLRKH